jgi:two-component system, OmpR family, sensor histidine kinase VicK
MTRPAKIKEHEPTAVKREMEEKITEQGQTGRSPEEAREIARSKGMAKEKTAGTAQTDKTKPGQIGTDNKLSTVSQKLIVAGSRKTEVWYGADKIVKRQLQILTKAEATVDACHSSESPSILVSFEPLMQTIVLLHKRGVRQRYITEITKENVKYCKQLANYFDLRHLDGVKGTLGIIDSKIYGAVANISESHLPTEFVYSDVKEFVDQQQYFFETLWNKAVPGEKKIREIEEGIPAEVTEIWYGSENIFKKSMEVLSRAKVSSDYCHNSKSPSIFVTNPHYLRTITELSERGIRHRFVTEITKENVEHCKQLAKYVELRHLDEVKGNFSIADGKEYGATANLSEFQPPTEFIHSNVKEFVDQQQYFFETLWNKAIPADKRIREIEEGVEPETVQTLNNSSEIQKLANKLVGSAKKELLIVFPTAAEFYRQQNDSNGFLKKLMLLQQEKGIASSKKERVAGTLDIRIAVPGDNANDNLLHHFQNLSQKARQEKKKYYSPTRIRSEIRYIDAVLSTNVAVIIVDRKDSLVIEVKDNKDDNDYDYTLKSNNVVPAEKEGNAVQKVHGLAIYTNSRALVMSTVSMFELLWTHIELYEELKLRDIERREFIDIAAHELRGPLQPILGLTKEIRSRYDLGKDNKMLGAILKSAANLQKLANNILDVARIESKSLELKISKFDLNSLVRDAIDDRKYELQHKNAVKIQFRSSYKCLLISADKHRIHQVVYNLLANAIKFTESGLISISTNKKDGEIIIFSVRDTGQGIEEEIMPKLFEKFAASPATTGTGLGLFISRKIIDAHGGNIYGINNPAHSGGKGATFTFTLPVIDTKPIKSHKL